MDGIFEIRELEGEKIVDYTFEQDPKRHVLNFGGGMICANCMVRIIIDKQLHRTSGDHGQQYGLPSPIDISFEFNEILKGKVIQSAAAKDKVGDLILKLEGDLKVEFINDFAGYEPWQIYLKSGKEYIAASGGEICSME